MALSMGFFWAFGFLSAAFAQTTPPCNQVRAAFDVGSGRTRMVVAQVNTCEQRIIKILKEDSVKVNYSSVFDKNSTGGFTLEIQKQGLAALVKLKAQADDFKPLAYSGVATAAFRKANNSADFVSEISKKLKINLRVISQEEEGELGFYSAMSVSSGDSSRLLVWDIGAGSMQFSFRDEKIHVIDGGLSSEVFKSRVIRVQNKGPEQNAKTSPNPLSEKDVELGFAEVLTGTTPLLTQHSDLLDRVQSKETEIIGMGGVLFNSLGRQILGHDPEGPFAFTAADVSQTLLQQVGKSDEQVGGLYASTDVTNLILVVGYMEALKIKSVRTVSVNNAHGVLVNPVYWAQR